MLNNDMQLGIQDLHAVEPMWNEFVQMNFGLFGHLFEQVSLIGSLTIASNLDN